MNKENDIKENEKEKVEEINVEEVNEPESVTREINLDDLYDGAINNTVMIDPITNDEVLMSSKKPNYTILGIIFAIIILLILYYVNNKTNLGRTTKSVEPKTTTTAPHTTKKPDTGTLTCTYSSKSDAESQSVTYVANYEIDKIINSNFNYVVMSNTNDSSAVIEDLKKQYETFFINNVSVSGNNVSYEKNDTGFTFNVETNYKRTGYDGLIIIENQTILFVKPTLDDTLSSMQDAYSKKGFNCSLTDSLNED